MKRFTVAIAMGVAGLTLAACSSSPGTTPTTAAGGTTKPTVATTTTKPEGTGHSPSSPIPLGQTASVDGWTVKVVSVAPEGTDPVSSTTAPGFASIVYTIQATRTDKDPASPVELTPEFLATNHLTYNADSQPGCYGGTPENNQVFTGGVAMHSACITVPSGVSSGLVLGMGEITQTWFATS